jgi:hypothetical protein
MMPLAVSLSTIWVMATRPIRWILQSGRATWSGCWTSWTASADSWRRGILRCLVRRSKKQYPVFLIQSISTGAAEELNLAFGYLDEHFVQFSRWEILGKELPEVDLMALLVRFKTDGAAKYLALMDRQTALVFFDRLEEGLPVEALLSIGT